MRMHEGGTFLLKERLTTSFSVGKSENWSFEVKLL